MGVEQLLLKTAKEFGLRFDHKNKFKFLVLTKREIIIRNFLGSCPDPLYVKYGNQEKNKIGVNLINFLQTKDYKRDVTKPHGCVISQRELKEEFKLILRIPDGRVKVETENFYNKIKKKIGQAKRLTLIWRPSEEEEKNQQRKEVILHEFVHELMENNKIRLESWRWNEGLITYVTNFVLNKHKRFEDAPPLGTDKMWNIYARYTHKWARLLKDTKNPTERKQIILNKIREVDRRHKERQNKK